MINQNHKTKTRSIKTESLSIDSFRLIELQEKSLPLIKQFERAQKGTLLKLLMLIRNNLALAMNNARFKENTSAVRGELVKTISDELAKLSLVDYVVICDSTNNPPSIIDQNDLRIEIAFKQNQTDEFSYVNGSFE